MSLLERSSGARNEERRLARYPAILGFADEARRETER